MALHPVTKGLDLPALGEPEQVIHSGRGVSRVAVLGADFPGLRPALRVAVGDVVKRGQPLLDDAAHPGVLHTAPGAGRVASINATGSGDLISLVIEVSDAQQTGGDDHQAFASFRGKPIPALSRDDVRALMIETGLWTSFRARPFGRTPNAQDVPDAILITAIDTEPLAPKPEVVVSERAAEFDAGLSAIAKLREGHMYLCVAKDSSIKAGPYSGITVEQFSGPHPAGSVGLHIHRLFPVDRKRKTAWHIGYQDVVRLGAVAITGRLDVEQIVAIAGPAAKSPRLIRTRLGASIREVTGGETATAAAHLVSGSVISGRDITTEVTAYLGRFDRQVACLHDARSVQSWRAPGGGPSALLSRIPGLLNRHALPVVKRPGALLRALAAGDASGAERLGALGLGADDLGVISALTGHDYGADLRKILDVLAAR